MVWGAIGINHKAGPVIFQNISPGRGNGIMALQYINQVLRLHLCPMLPVTSITCSSRIMSATTLPVSPAAQHQNHATVCPQSGFKSKRAIVGRNPKKTQSSATKADNCSISECSFWKWAAIPMTIINHLIHSMYRKCMPVVNDHGGNTKY